MAKMIAAPAPAPKAGAAKGGDKAAVTLHYDPSQATALPMVRRGNCAFTDPVWTLIDGGVDAGLIDGGPVAEGQPVTLRLEARPDFRLGDLPNVSFRPGVATTALLTRETEAEAPTACGKSGCAEARSRAPSGPAPRAGVGGRGGTAGPAG